MAFTKEKLAKLGITIEADSIEDDEAFALIEKKNINFTSKKSNNVTKNLNVKLLTVISLTI